MFNVREEMINRPSETLEDNPLISKIKIFSAFWKTRKAIHNRECLYDYTRQQLREKNYLGPWSFNLYESFLISIPVVVFFKVISFLGQTKEQTMFDAIESWLIPLAVPLFLTLQVWFISKGSLKREDINTQNIKRSKYAYLYIDGAYGIISQSLMVFGLVIKSFLETINYGFDDFIYIIPVLLFLIGFLHQFYVIYYLVPRRLFIINGYNPDKSDRKKNAPPDSSPYRRYGIMFNNAMLLTFFLVILIYQLINLAIVLTTG